MIRSWKVVVVAALSAVLVLPACGADDKAAQRRALGGTKPVKMTLSKSGIEVKEKVTAGAVRFELSFRDETLDGRDTKLEEANVSFTRVKKGTEEIAFKEAMAKVLAGGPFPDFIEGTAGIFVNGGRSAAETVLLGPGSYIVWATAEYDERPRGGGSTTTTAVESEGLTIDDIVTTSFEAVTGESDNELPETDGVIVARDYTFDIDVSRGDKYTFRNDGPEQFHQVALFDFDDLEADVVERNLDAFLERGEDDPLPPALKDVDLDTVEAGGSGVFGPGDGAGTFSVDLSKGDTYAAVCFISDRTGGPPHAFAHGMRKVFTV